MNEYIERERLLRRFNIDDMMNVNGTLISLEDARNTISNFPTADVVPMRHGRWIGIPLCGSDDCECSECGNWCNIHVNLCGEPIQKYCPYCGAKMDGGSSNATSRW